MSHAAAAVAIVGAGRDTRKRQKPSKRRARAVVAENAVRASPEENASVDKRVGSDTGRRFGCCDIEHGHCDG